MLLAWEHTAESLPSFTRGPTSSGGQYVSSEHTKKPACQLGHGTLNRVGARRKLKVSSANRLTDTESGTRAVTSYRESYTQKTNLRLWEWAHPGRCSIIKLGWLSGRKERD